MRTLPTPDMLESFLGEAWEAVSTLEQAPALLAQDPQPLVVMAHRLKGSAGLYGFSEVSQLGGLLERIFERAPSFTAFQREKAAEFSRLAAACLSEALERIASSGEEGEVGLALGQAGGAGVLLDLLEANPTAFRPASLAGQADGDQPKDYGGTGLHDIPAQLRRFRLENPEVWEYFAPEVSEHLEAIHAATEALLASGGAAEHLTALFRSMHTIKGAAYSVGCTPIGTLAHRLEDLLVEVREGSRPWDAAVARVILQGSDTLGLMLSAAEGRETPLMPALEEAHRLLGGVWSEGAAPSPPGTSEPVAQGQVSPAPVPRSTVRVSLQRLEALMNLASDAIVSRARLERLAAQLEEASHTLEVSQARFQRTAAEFEARYLNPRLASSEARPQDGARPALTLSSGLSLAELFSELEFDRYDDLSILARSIAEMSADLGELKGQLGQLARSFKRESETLKKLTRDLRGEVGRMRLVPMGRLYQRLKRIVRQSEGKQVRLELSGELVEVDNLVLEGLADPLVHLVNNAIAHGIESPEVRLAQGKGPEGRVVVRTFQRGSFVYVEVQDDGRGIDLEAVKRQAVLQGLRRPEEVQSLTPEQAVELIFLPGLSTSETVTRQAGRGVGMDVVLTNLRRLKGDIVVQTEPGLGTLFRLRVPLSLIVSDVLMVEVGKELLAIPGESLRTLRTVRAQDLLERDGHPALEFEGQAVPILYLHELLGRPLPQGPRRSFAIVEAGEGRLALGVDAFLGLEQTVVKSLDEPVGSLPHLAGATISAEGRVIVVLNPGGLRRVEAPRWSAAMAGSTSTPLERGLKILLADDSLSIRRVVGQMLTRWGHRVHTAGDGYEALELLQDNRYDVVITDLEMPRVNGFELLDEVRRRPDLRETPVFVLTSRAGEKHQALASELGASGYLTKPLEEVKLKSLLSTVKKRAEV
ncbi:MULTISPECIES: response regulator [unclassified Meiothermus]|uniref:hybrid sensor histidine kinase/response regulator n=1 Tax=unclassified Meiothermus TaxID=370471 RepID=UPI000D7D0D82|nr:MULTISPECIES: response regulator [unclassified Meiothermus]PZA06888.1 histidine kinase [Meiothermus sp. Pnk-1]RYM30868.1 response regulator [Meiothermus sp. PNK-Is4]